MKRMVDKSRDVLGHYADNDLWFIIPALGMLIVYMFWHQGYFGP